jgi:fucose 4-O-acetylase-like acetyltransferase
MFHPRALNPRCVVVGGMQQVPIFRPASPVSVSPASVSVFRLAPSPAPRPRDPWLDNARFGLIALVVLGHALEPLAGQSAWLDAAYRFVYLFHIPAFAFLSGAVTSPVADARLLRGIAFRLLLPYLAFQGLYALAAQVPGWPDDGPSGVATPYWILWYLPSLACWRLLLPLFARLRYRLALAVLLALAAGCASDLGYGLSLSRTLVFFPLFLLGWRFGPSWRQGSQQPPVRLLALAVLGGLLLLAIRWTDAAPWLYGSLGYASLGAGVPTGLALRLLQMTAAALGCAAYLSLVPRRLSPVSLLGGRSLPAYLLHGFVVKLAVAAGAFELLDGVPAALSLPLLLGLSLLCVAALSSTAAQRLLQPIVAPRWLEQRLWCDTGHLLVVRR